MIKALLEAQNPDGGWGATLGARSWTEPTAWALIALQNTSAASAALARGVSWLRQGQLISGGWQASPGVGDPCWVVGLVSVLPAQLLGESEHSRALDAVRSGMEALPQWTDRLRQWMLGYKPGSGPIVRGWPRVPGTAAWLIPTVISALALRKQNVISAADRLLLEHSLNYLRARQCQDGGWNHGSSRALGYEASAYPETTGLALLAPRGISGETLDRGLAAADRLGRQWQTMEGAAWLSLALHAHGKSFECAPTARSVSDLRELAIAHISERCRAGEELLWRT